MTARGRAGAAHLAGHAVALAAGVWLLWRVPEPGEAPAGEPAPPGPPPAPPGLSPALSVPGPPAPLASPPALSVPGPPAPLASPPALAVVIPARDEATRLPRLLTSLAAQSVPPDELIVVDDHSADATAELARAAGATVVTAPALPAGWLGKPWACHCGAGAAGAELLLFLDADVVLAPDAIGRLVAEHRRAGGLVSVQPYHVPERAYEQLSAVCNAVTMMGTGGFSGPPRHEPAMAFGPCLLVDRRSYRRAGGHAHPDVRAEVCEDAALARRVRETGGSVGMCAGGRTVRFRMYPGGPRQLADGWSKMLAGGGRRAPRLPAVVTSLWVSGALLGAGRGVRAVSRPRRGRWAGAAVDAGVYLVWVAEMGWVLGRVGRWHPAAVAGFPVPLAVFVGLCARSAVLAASGRPARWRGRPVPAR